MSEQGILGGLKSQLGDYAQALGRKALSSAGDQVDKLADRFEGSGGAAGDAAKEGAEKLAEGESPAKAAASAATTGAKDKIKGIFGGGGDSGGGASGNKFINIVEWVDVGVPVNVAYNAFTQYEDWPDFMKKVENVQWSDDVTLSIKGQVFWSHRTWEATITEQVADSHIVWSSTGEKGSISGSVSFHELSPTLTRMVAIGEYHPQGFMERTGNIWRAVGRRFRLELKFFVHHAMTDVMLDPDSYEGWRGEIRDGELVTSHEDAVEQEQQDAEEAEEQPEEDEQGASDEYEEEAPAEEEEEPPPEDEEPVDEEPAAEEEEEPAAEEDAEEPPAEDEEPAPEEEEPAEEEDEPADTDEDR